MQMLSKIDEVRATESPIIATARDEIARIRKSADDQVKASNELIQQLREKIKVDGGVDIDAIIDEQNEKIKSANVEIDKLTEEKYKLEAEYRKLEAEVGPIKYIAELIYGENVEKDLLEKAVRWVIITIIFVFDPLAVLLLIASQYTFEWRRNDVNASRKDDRDGKPKPQKEQEQTPEEKMEKAMGDNKFEDVSDEVLEEEIKLEFWEQNQVDWNKNAMEYGNKKDDKEIEELLEKADPEVLEEVAKELEIEKQVDKEPYDPYNDSREDEELTPEELEERKNMKLYSPNGKLAINPGNRKVKSVKIKSIAEKAEDNKKDNEE